MKSLLLKNLFVFGAVAVGFSPVCRAQAQLAGDWQGTLDANGTPVRIVWHVAAAANGAVTSTFDNLDEAIYGIKVKSLSLKGTDLNLAVEDTVQVNGQDMKVSGTFVGTVNKDVTELTGIFTQTEPQPQPPAQLHLTHGPAQAASAMTVPPSIAGDWLGTLSAGGAELRLLLHISAAQNGAFTATMDSLDQGVNGIPINTITLKDGKLSLTVDAVHGTYDGTVNKDASEIDGTWSQGQPLALNLKRTTIKPQVAAKPGIPSDIDGTWQGAVDAPQGKLRINFKIVNLETGLSATIQSPDQSPLWAPATSVTRAGDKLTIEMKAFGASFEGTINATKDTIDGTFSQGGGSLPLVLKKG
jgi:hypothetical protein